MREALGVTSSLFFFSVFLKSMGYGLLPPSRLPSSITNNHHPWSLAEVTSFSSWRPNMPSCSEPAAQGRGSGRATLSLGGAQTRGLRKRRKWDFEHLLHHVLARYLCPPCLPDPQCIITCSSQLFLLDTCDTNKCLWWADRQRKLKQFISNNPSAHTENPRSVSSI